MPELSPRQQVARQAGVGLILAGILLAILALVFSQSARRFGSYISSDPEDISLQNLLARGIDGNPHVRVREFFFAKEFVFAMKPKSHPLDDPMWKYVLLPIYPTNQPQDGQSLQAIVKHQDLGSQIQVSRYGESTSSIRGMVINKVSSLGSRDLELLKKAFPGQNFSSVLLIEADREPPWAHWGKLSVLGIVIVVLGAGILGLSFLPAPPPRRPAKRPRAVKPRRPRDDEEEEVEEVDPPARSGSRSRPAARRSLDEEDRLRRKRQQLILERNDYTAHEVISWVVVAFLTALSLVATAVVFVIVPGPRGGILGAAMLVGTGAFFWSLLVARGNSELPQVILWIIPFYYFYFALKNWDRYGVPFIIGVVANIIGFVAMKAPTESSPSSNQTPVAASPNLPPAQPQPLPPPPQRDPVNPPLPPPRPDPQQPPVPKTIEWKGPPCETTDIALPGTIADVFVGGAGKVLVLQLATPRKLVLFNVEQGKLYGDVPLPDGTVHIAAGGSQLILLAPASALEVWDLATAMKVRTSPLPLSLLNKEMWQIATASAMDGPVFVSLKEEKRTLALDVASMQTGEVFWKHWKPRNAYGPLQMQVAPDGSFLVGSDGGWAGIEVATLQGAKQVAVTDKIEASTELFILPSADGKRIFTPRGIVGPDLITTKFPELKNAYLVPAREPGYFLAFRGKGDRDLPHFSRNKKVKLPAVRDVVVSTEDGKTVFLMEHEEWNTVSDLGWEKRTHYYPSAKLLITIPDKDKLRLRRF